MCIRDSCIPPRSGPFYHHNINWLRIFPHSVLPCHGTGNGVHVPPSASFFSYLHPVSYTHLDVYKRQEWTLIESNYLQNHYTFPFWLSISGLHYYLPAIMSFSWKEYSNKKDIVLVADSAALALEKFNDYSIYTNPQLNILIKWAGTLNFEI